ncbi:aminotransferase class IV [Streptomyces sp. ISL-14]|uniref:aminotransferase class IV n=1 Tax=Bacillus sp. ISL-4 TaxID=2819125 RepID=UPI001C13DD9D|nr:aminotransferase class IV [Bacillus sp. ISL-4]MBT2672500.1 aminotransferase class IV [Streptomyces sp. ISL-14]
MISAYFNGKFVEPNESVVPIDERGHQFGDGVYEVIRIYDSKPFMMDEHLDRLYRSADAIKLRIDPNREALKDTMLELIQKSGLTNLDLYVQVTWHPGIIYSRMVQYLFRRLPNHFEAFLLGIKEQVSSCILMSVGKTATSNR